MHELALMTEAVRMAEEAARRSGAAHVASITLRVGALSGAVPEALEFAWEAARLGTMLEGARLQIIRVDPVCWCAACQAEFPAESFFSVCPRCRALSGELRAGREMDLAEVEVVSTQPNLTH
jgi:hydrogenase nickel incorporation protein HypA/HybF